MDVGQPEIGCKCDILVTFPRGNLGPPARLRHPALRIYLRLTSGAGSTFFHYGEDEAGQRCTNAKDQRQQLTTMMAVGLGSLPWAISAARAEISAMSTNENPRPNATPSRCDSHLQHDRCGADGGLSVAHRLATIRQRRGAQKADRCPEPLASRGQRIPRLQKSASSAFAGGISPGVG
jgi:hypothetical protein